MSRYLVEFTREIDDPPQRLFDIVADPAMHPRMDGGGTVTGSFRNAPARLSLGAEFGMSMKLGAAYRIMNTVVEFDEPRVIAWQHFGRHVWRYTFEPLDGGARTRVTEQWDARQGRGRVLTSRLFARRLRHDLPATLERLADLAASNGSGTDAGGNHPDSHAGDRSTNRPGTGA